MDIDTMPAGRELDALVAEKVVKRDIHVYECPASPFSRKNGRCCCVPHYSTYIAAAWEVVEKLRADGYRFRGVEEHDEDPGWRCLVGKPSFYPSYEAHADTAPLAICPAALKAVC